MVDVTYCILRPPSVSEHYACCTLMPELVSSVRVEIRGLVGQIPVEFELYLFLPVSMSYCKA